MNYKNAKTILPERLLVELQEYVQGEIIYVPKTQSIRARWGENNGTKEKYNERNHEIVALYKQGIRMCEIADRYHLSEDSIKKIVTGGKLKKASYHQCKAKYCERNPQDCPNNCNTENNTNNHNNKTQQSGNEASGHLKDQLYQI